MIDYLRRCDLNRMTEEEKLIRSATIAVEKLGADARLTEVISLLEAAKIRLGDWVDNIEGRHTVPLQAAE